MAVQYYENKFVPAWWLANRHLQTIFPTLVRRKIDLPLRRERMELPDGDFIDLDWSGPDQGPLAIILHGLAGSIDSPYARGIVKAINQNGWRAVFMHFRGCSGTPNRLPRYYHSGETGDTDYVMNELRKREPSTVITVVGFSLGGNVLLKWLGETGHNNPVTAAVAISVPFDLENAAANMQKGSSRAYQWWLLRMLKKNLKRKANVISLPVEGDEIDEIKSFLQLDEKITAPLHGFVNALDYYTQSSSKQYLPLIKKPTLILHSADDPFMTQEVIPTPEELSAHIELEVYKRGGHVGFIAGPIPGKPTYWLEERIPAFLNQFS